MNDQKAKCMRVELVLDRSEYERFLAVTRAVRERRPVGLGPATEVLQAFDYGLRAAKPLGK
ncbi:hypothetical protein [Microbulbifer sp. PSTR4-B]|uniref:hypothetical protein n=1 Tax=Microbulbifer sp. PSTR4-B TaxID=3243396 RepID=UPI004039371C